jgi:Rho termination factor-like protein
MTKAELESKHIAELHALAAEAGVSRYRMLPREELVEKLASSGPAKAERSERPERRERPERERSERRERPPRRRPERPREPERRESAPREQAPPPEPAPPEPAPPEPAAPAAPEAEGGRPRRRRRRRFGRRDKGLNVHDLLLPPPGRQALVYGESRAVCTALLREIAAELAGASKGPDPIALLVDPTPEELAEWKREASQAELVVAAQARHAGDALAQAQRRAESGEHVILLVDSFSKLEDPDTAKEIFDAGLSLASSGSLTVVAALERPT